MQQTISVSQLVQVLNDTLELTFPFVEVEGEIASFKVWNDRLAFFDLKDETAVVNCMLPLGRMKVPLADGMKVLVTATPQVTKKGRLSITVSSLELSGEGSIKRAFELLHRKLDAEGLFSTERKRTLVDYPNSIGVITSLESAAYQDFLTILNARWGGVGVVSCHVQVQGESSVDQIVGAIEYFNQISEPVDTLVLTRGGGSLEDLAAFNTEPVTRAVAGSRTPIVVAVGHETDTSLADLAADVRAATPTDAARLVVPDKREVLAQTQRHHRYLEVRMTHYLESINRDLRHFTHQLRRTSDIPRERLLTTSWRLHHALKSHQERVCNYREDVHLLRDRLASAYLRHCEAERSHLMSMIRILDGFDPRAVLRRGYGIIRHEQRLVTSLGQVSVGDTLMIQLHSGTITSEVIDVKNE